MNLSFPENQAQIQDALLKSFENTPLAMMCWEIKEQMIRVIDWNKSSERILGWKKGEVIGRNFLSFLVPEKDHNKAYRIIESIVSKKHTHNLCYHCHTKSGEQKLLHWYNTPVYNQELDIFFVISLAEDVTDIVRKEAELIESEKKYKSLFDDNHSVMLIINPATGKITDANPAACQYYGYSFLQLTSMYIQEINTLQGSEVKQSMSKAVDSKKQHFFFVHQLASGEKRHVEVYTGTVTIRGKERLYSIVHDIEDRIKAEEALLEAKKDVEESDRLKSMFLSQISHEIRTPLNSILGFTELLEQGNIEPNRQQVYFEMLKKGASQLLNTLNNIYDITQIQMGEITLNPQSFDLVELLYSLRDELELKKESMNKSDVAIQLDIAPNMQRSFFTTDRDLLMLMLRKLSSNALKFTKDGVVRIGFTQPQQDAVLLHILDTGPGIPEALLPHVYDAFRQGDESLSRGHGGIGLGLSIVKAVSSMLKGKITLNTKTDIGTQFFIEIPDLG